MYQKSIKNRHLGLPWDPFGYTLGPLGKHLGHMFPKDWILEALGKVLGTQSEQLGSNLEAQEAPKPMPSPQKIDVKNVLIFHVDFVQFWL